MRRFKYTVGLKERESPFSHWFCQFMKIDEWIRYTTVFLEQGRSPPDMKSCRAEQASLSGMWSAPVRMYYFFQCCVGWSFGAHLMMEPLKGEVIQSEVAHSVGIMGSQSFSNFVFDNMVSSLVSTCACAMMTLGFLPRPNWWCQLVFNFQSPNLCGDFLYEINLLQEFCYSNEKWKATMLIFVYKCTPSQ